MSQVENVETTTQVENAPVTAAPVLKLTISSVLELLAQGKNRKEIAAFYGRTQTEMNKLVWSHPKLKGRKIKKQYTGIELEDDVEDVVAENEVVETEAEPAIEEVAEEVAEMPAPNEFAPELANAFPVTPTEASVETTAPSTSDWTN